MRDDEWRFRQEVSQQMFGRLRASPSLWWRENFPPVDAEQLEQLSPEQRAIVFEEWAGVRANWLPLSKDPELAGNQIREVLSYWYFQAKDDSFAGPGGQNNKRVVLAVFKEGMSRGSSAVTISDVDLSPLAGMQATSLQRARERVSEGAYWFRWKGKKGAWVRDRNGVAVRAAGVYHLKASAIPDDPRRQVA